MLRLVGAKEGQTKAEFVGEPLISCFAKPHYRYVLLD